MTPELRSLRQSLRSLDRATLDRVIRSLPAKAVEALRYDWELFARDKQLPPPGLWRTWVPLAGRGWGKTRTGSEWVRSKVYSGAKRIALVAETQKDLEQVMCFGDSGLLSVFPPHQRPRIKLKPVEIRFHTGAIALGYNATTPDQLRGPQFDAAWCDELAKWRYAQETWDMLQFGLRLGDMPQALVTTTPRPVQVLRDILADPSTVHTVGSTYENAGNLAASFADYIRRKYEGTRLGRQELDAAILDDNPGALWKRSEIDARRLRSDHAIPELSRIVVAIDPPVTSGEDADECGIIAAGVTGRASDPGSRGYVLEDASEQGLTPRQWAEKAVRLFHKLKANLIVAEVNNGGELVETVIRQIDPNIPFKAVHASKGKFARAEPISAIYEQGRIHHVGTFAALEDQMCEFGVDGLRDPNASPDRVDALVWALSELMLEAPPTVAMILSKRNRG